MPSPRSDMALELHLDKILSVASAESVKEAIALALAHVRSGPGGRRRGGKRLTELLSAARLSSARAEVWEVLRSLQDAVHYTEGHLLRPDYEEKYRLHYFARGPRDRFGPDSISRTTSAILELWCMQAEKYLVDHPDASLENVLNHVRKVGEDARFM